jgi:hypothetical protein
VTVARRTYLAVAACALLVYVGALWNRWAWDDVPIIVYNPLLLSARAFGSAFVSSYWPPQMGGGLYRPLPIVTYALDLRLGTVAWFHAVNLLWHAGVSVAVAMLARRWSGDRAGLIAGVLFAVHPLHVEAVANIVGRAELMAALFAVLAVYAALARDALGWSLAALAGGLLSKENAAVVPGLIVWGWVVGLARPSRRRMAVWVAGWASLAVAYLGVRFAVLAPFERVLSIAPVFVGASPLEIRLTAVAALADVARLLVFPLTLRVDYSPAERTIVTSVLDPRVAAGLACVALWGVLLARAWRRGETVEAFGLGWIAIALLPVANLVLPIGVLVAERTLYLPSVGLALAVGAWLPHVAPRRWPAILALVAAAGGVRTAVRVPVWRDDGHVIWSELRDSPRSVDGPARMVTVYLNAHQPTKALDAFRVAAAIYDRLPWLYVRGADAAFVAGRPAVADSALGRLEALCRGCDYYYRFEAVAARARGDSTAAAALLSRLPPHAAPR